MPNPVVDYTVARNLVWEQLNAASAAYGTWNESDSSDPRWQQAAVDDWIVNADFRVATMICNTAGHPKENYYQVISGNLNYGDPAPVDMVGPARAVMIKGADNTTRLGRPTETDWIDFFNADSAKTFGGPAFTDRYYQLLDGHLYFSGASAQIKYCTVSRGTAAVNGLVSPPEFIDTVILLALISPLMKEQDFMEAAAFFQKQAEAHIQIIMGGGSIVPPVQLLQQRQAA